MSRGGRLSVELMGRAESVAAGHRRRMSGHLRAYRLRWCEDKRMYTGVAFVYPHGAAHWSGHTMHRQVSRFSCAGVIAPGGI